ncbi:ATP-dependent metallopeptidase FtsH/Yme1/Tma family protein [Candidatus Microgenomates bacterium]|nr:ATP-dependent metallopeptidase FtsH/Yme1/Tma family protein [Candidatus Microgenomates bacterium]
MANNHKKKLNGRMWSVAKGVAVYVLIALATLFFFYSFSEKPDTQNLVPISQIISDIKEGKVEKITLEKDRVTAKMKDEDKTFSSRKEEGESIYKILESSGVDPKSITIEIKELF